MMDSTLLNGFPFKANNPREVGSCCTTASRLEVNASPKPGNVHKFSDPVTHGKTLEQFHAAINAIAPHYENAATMGYDAGRELREIDRMVHVGPVLLGAARSMVAAETAGNLLLGHIMLLVPIAFAAGYLAGKKERGDLAKKGSTLDDLKFIMHQVINSGDTDDVISLYEAIRTANPGGMGAVERFDVNAPGFRDELRVNAATFKDVFSINSDVDSISSEWVTGFDITFGETFPRLHQLVTGGLPANDAIVQLFLETLAGRPDSLITRKSGIERAKDVSMQARAVVDRGGMFTSAGRQEVARLDAALAGAGGKLNPGTTADLCAAAICLLLLSGFKLA